MDLRSRILAARDLPRECLHIPEWDCDVWIRTLTAYERDKFEADQVVRRNGTAETNLVNLRARFAILVVCDETGKPIFAPEDAAELGRKSAKVLERIADVGRRLNGIGERELEEAEKNSVISPNGVSISVSPLPSA